MYCLNSLGGVLLALAVAAPALAASQSGRDDSKHYKSLSAYESAMTANPATPAPKPLAPAVVIAKKKAATSETGSREPVAARSSNNAAGNARK